MARLSGPDIKLGWKGRVPYVLDPLTPATGTLPGVPKIALPPE